MRRYHHSPSTPFLIAGVEPVGSSLSGLNGSLATSVAQTPQRLSIEAKKARIVFLMSLFLSGLSVGAGLALEFHVFPLAGQALQAFGFVLAAIGIIRCPKGE